MKHYISFALSLLIILAIVVSGCSSTTEEQLLNLKDMTWEEIMAAADGQTINWWMWGGSDPINTWRSVPFPAPTASFGNSSACLTLI